MKTCNVCNVKYQGDICPECKGRLEKEHSAKINAEKVERIKREYEITQEEADRLEAIFFEYDEEITLRDGKVYKIPPCSLKKAKRLMNLLKSINVDVVIMNFIPTGNTKEDEQREKDLYEILMMGFVNYPEVTIEYLEEYVDLITAKKIFNILIGLNGIKK